MYVVFLKKPMSGVHIYEQRLQKRQKRAYFILSGS